MEAIIRLRRIAIQKGFRQSIGARHITAFMEVVQREGVLNEGLLPVKMLWRHPSRWVRTLPLAWRMWRRGKLQFPFKPPIPGIEGIRRLFEARRTSESRGDMGGGPSA